MGRDTLHILRDNPAIYDKLAEYGAMLEEGFTSNLKETNTPGAVTRFRSMVCLFFGEFDTIRSFEDVKHADTDTYARYFKEMIGMGIILALPNLAIFLSDAHTKENIEYLIASSKKPCLRSSSFPSLLLSLENGDLSSLRDPAEAGSFL